MEVFSLLKRWWKLIVIFGLALFVLSSCQSQATAPTLPSSTPPPFRVIPTLQVFAMDYSYRKEPNVAAGLVKILLKNNGGVPHQASVVALHDHVTLKGFLDKFLTDESASYRMVSFVGGINTLEPGATQEGIFNFATPGNYAILCFVPTPDGKPHFSWGMSTEFTVTNEKVPGEQNLLKVIGNVNGNIQLHDFGYNLPVMRSGWFDVKNEGKQPHELALVALLPGKTLDDFNRFNQNPLSTPPFTFAGGMGALDPISALVPSGEGWIHLELKSGNYVALCYVMDPTTHQRHLMKGMSQFFVVK